MLGIAVYTLRTWGETQTTRYIDDVEKCCQMLAVKPKLGRAFDNVHPGLRRMECGQHVVFYREDRDGILISRILHKSMLPERHTVDDEGDQA